MHFIQPTHLQDCVISQHHQQQQVACGETHRVPCGIIPLGLLERGANMEGDHHDLSLQHIFTINHNCNCCEVYSGSYMLQLASAALSIPSSPALQLPSPKSRRPWARRGGRWLPQQHGLHSYILLHSGTKLSVVLHRAADDRSGSNRILEADCLQHRRIRQWSLNFGRSSLRLQYTCTFGRALTTSLLVSSGSAYITCSRSVIITRHHINPAAAADDDDALTMGIYTVHPWARRLR